MNSLDISVVIPLFNEEESLPELHAWIRRVMNEYNFSYEIIFVDDGSTDSSWSIIERLRREHNDVKGIKFQRNYGKSPALHCAFQKVKGEVIITMDADLQDSPDEIPELYRMIKEDGYDLVSHRVPRAPEVPEDPAWQPEGRGHSRRRREAHHQGS